MPLCPSRYANSDLSHSQSHNNFTTSEHSELRRICAEACDLPLDLRRELRKSEAKFLRVTPTHRGALDRQWFHPVMWKDPTHDFAPTGTATELFSRQPPGDRSRSSPSPASV